MKKILSKTISMVAVLALVLAGLTVPAMADEPEKIVFANWTINTLPSEDAIQSVEDAINEITIPTIGVEVDYKVYPVAEYVNTVALQLQSGEQVDLFCCIYSNLISNVSQEMCYDFGPLVDEYLPDAKALIPADWWDCVTINGGVYACPVFLPSAMYLNLTWRSDISDELGLAMDSVNTVQDLDTVFKAVHAAHPEMYCLIGGNAGFGGWSGMTYAIPNVDTMGDNALMPAGVLMGDSDTVVNLFDTEEYMAQMKLVRSWYEKGYIMQDLATTTFTNVEILSSGNAFANITGQGSYPEMVAKNATIQTSQPLASKALGDSSVISTSGITNQPWCVASTSKHTEAALKFLNLQYCNADIANLIQWGIKDRDYVVNEDGTVQPPEGLDASSVPYPGGYMNCGTGYCGLEYPMLGTTKEAIDFGVKGNYEAKRSRSFGFVFDTTPVINQYAAVNNVIMQYYSGLDCGSVDTESTIAAFNKDLHAAGIDDIIAEKQRQYDAWRNAK